MLEDPDVCFNSYDLARAAAAVLPSGHGNGRTLRVIAHRIHRASTVNDHEIVVSVLVEIPDGQAARSHIKV